MSETLPLPPEAVETIVENEDTGGSDEGNPIEEANSGDEAEGALEGLSKKLEKLYTQNPELTKKATARAFTRSVLNQREFKIATTGGEAGYKAELLDYIQMRRAILENDTDMLIEMDPDFEDYYNQVMNSLDGLWVSLPEEAMQSWKKYRELLRSTQPWRNASRTP